MQFSTFQDLCREIEAVQHLTYDWTPLENDLKAGRTYVVFGITPLICAEVGASNQENRTGSRLRMALDPARRWSL